MAQLEVELDTKLFIRGKRLALTDAGVMLRRRAEEVVSLMDKIESEFEEKEDVGGVISIGSGGLTASHHLPAVMAGFRKKYLKVQFRFHTNSAKYIKEQMDQGLLAQKEHITKEDIFGLPIITTDRLSLQKESEHWLGGSFSRLNIFATYNIITNVAMLVSSGVAAAITIEGAVNLFDSQQLVFRPLFPEVTMTSVLAWKKFQPNFSAAGKFLEYFGDMH